MDSKIMNLTFASSLTDVVEANESFDMGVLRIAYEGENRNKSSISHDAFVKALDSIKCVPVVAHYSVEDDRIGGHDVGVVKDSKGNLRLINYTEPVGVVTESAQQWFEDVTEDDGTVHTYLFTHVVLWKRQAAYRKLKEDGITNHSMEISIKSGHKKDGIFHIDDFEFTAFCLLGNDVQPCFESSALETFSASTFKEDFAKMMFELKQFAKQVNTPNGVDNKHPQENLTEGGNEVLSEKMELAAKYGVDVDSLDFSIEDFSLEELEQKFAEMTASESAEDAGDADGETSGETDSTVDEVNPEDADEEDDGKEVDINDDEAMDVDDTFALNSNIREELCRELYKVTYSAPWGEDYRYWFVDFDAEKSEVYAQDCEKRYLCGMPFKMNGDAVEIDFDAEKRMKFVIVDFEENDSDDGYQSIIDLLFTKISDKCKENETLSAEFAAEKESMASANVELETLRAFKADIEAKEDKAQKDAVFSLFTDLDGIEAFEALKQNCAGMTIDELRKECFAVRGEFGMTANFSANSEKGIKIKVVKDKKENEPYGGIVEKYINRK